MKTGTGGEPAGPGNAVTSGLFVCPTGLPMPRPGVVVLHGTDGLQDHHREVARALAEEGYAAVAPRWFGTPDRPGWRDLQLEDLGEVWKFIQRADGVDGARIGWVGFSRGGGLAVFAASLFPASRAVVNFFGLTTWNRGYGELPHLPLRREDPLAFVDRVRCPILSLHGDKDTVVPVEATRRLDEACRSFSVPHEMHIYPGVDHSFVWPESPRYDRTAHGDGWARALEFLARHLGP